MYYNYRYRRPKLLFYSLCRLASTELSWVLPINLAPRIQLLSPSDPAAPAQLCLELIKSSTSSGTPPNRAAHLVSNSGGEGTGARGAPVPVVGIELKFRHAKVRRLESPAHEERVNSQ